MDGYQQDNSRERSGVSGLKKTDSFNYRKPTWS